MNRQSLLPKTRARADPEPVGRGRQRARPNARLHEPAIGVSGMAQTKRDRAGRDIPQTVTARTRGLPEAEHSVRSTGGSTGAGSPRSWQDHLSFCAVADK